MIAHTTVSVWKKLGIENEAGWSLYEQKNKVILRFYARENGEMRRNKMGGMWKKKYDDDIIIFQSSYFRRFMGRISGEME